MSHKCGEQVKRVSNPYMVNASNNKSTLDRAIDSHQSMNNKANQQYFAAQGIHTSDSDSASSDQTGGSFFHHSHPVTTTTSSEGSESTEPNFHFDTSSYDSLDSSSSFHQQHSVSSGIPRLGNNTIELSGVSTYQGTEKNPGPFNIQCSSSQSGGGDLFSTIVNPETGRRVSVHGVIGRRVLRKYLRHSKKANHNHQVGGAADGLPDFSRPFTATYDVDYKTMWNGELIKKWTFSQPELNVHYEQEFSKPLHPGQTTDRAGPIMRSSQGQFFWDLKAILQQIPHPEEYWDEEFVESADFWMKPCTPHNAGKTCWRESEHGKLLGVMPKQGHCIAREKTLALFLSAQLLNDEWEPTGSIMSIHELRKMQNDKKKNFSGKYRKIYNCKWAWKGKCES